MAPPRNFDDGISIGPPGANPVVVIDKNGNAKFGGQVSATTLQAATISGALSVAGTSSLSSLLTLGAGLTVTTGTSTFGGPVQMAQGGDLTAAATLTTGSDGNYFGIIGTTAITMITTTGCSVGRQVWLTFQSAGATLTHNTTATGLAANILTGSAGTWTSRANSMACLILTSTGATTKSWIIQGF